MKAVFTAFGLVLTLAAFAQEGKSPDPTDEKSAAQPNEYQNPVDGKTYAAPGGWNTYQPAGGVKPTVEKVSLEGVRLLQSQDEVGSRTTAPELAAFIDLAHKAAAEVFAAYTQPTVLMVQFTCVPGKCPARIAYQGEPPPQLLQAYSDRLTQLQPLRVSGEVKFQFILKVRP